jgi:hypothetical protein
MNDERDQQRASELRIVEVLIDEHASVDCNLVQIGETWAIHGLVAVDGDVIMAEFGNQEDAEEALQRIVAAEEERHSGPAGASIVAVECVGVEVIDRRSP